MINRKSFLLIYPLEKRYRFLNPLDFFSSLILILPTFRRCDLFSKNYFCKFIITSNFSQLVYTKYFWNISDEIYPASIYLFYSCFSWRWPLNHSQLSQNIFWWHKKFLKAYDLFLLFLQKQIYLILGVAPAGPGFAQIWS